MNRPYFESIDDSFKSLKAKYYDRLQQLRLAKEKLTTIEGINSEQMIETLKDSALEVCDSISKMIDNTVRRDTGMTIAEIKSKISDGQRLFKMSIGSVNEMPKKLVDEETADASTLTAWKAKASKDYWQQLQKWLAEQSNEVYNAFCMMFINNLVSKSQTLFYELKEKGTTISSDVTSEFSMFKSLVQPAIDNTGANSAPQSNANPDSSVSSPSEASNLDSSIIVYLNMLKGSEVKESALKEVLETHTLTAGTANVINLFDKLASTIGSVVPLVENFRTNKQAAKDMASKSVADSFDSRCISAGFDTSVKVAQSSGISRTHSISFTNRTLFDNADQSSIVKQGDIVADLDGSISDAGKENEGKKTLKELRNTYQDVEYMPEAGYAYVSEVPSNPSEIMRMKTILTYAGKDCKLDESKPLSSKSTEESGAMLVNAGYAGNSLSEIEDAINRLNKGKRL